MAKYQYETSPRKIKPDYSNPNRKKSNNIKENKKQQSVKKAQAKKKTLKKIKTVLYVTIGFALFFTISYRNAIIDIKYAEIKDLKSKLAVVQKENEQLEANLEQKLNLKTIQEEAQSSLGMRVLSTDQIEYINLSKKDHIEASVSEVEEDNYFQKILIYIKKFVK